MSVIYPEACGGFFASAFPGQEPGSTIVYFERQSEGFVVVPPPGVDWADYEAQPDLEVPQPDDEEGNPVPPVLVPQAPIRHPRDPWLYYQQEMGVERDQPTWEEVEAWSPPRESEAAPLTAFDATFLRVQKKLDGDEYKRTGKLVDPSGAVSRARAYAAAAMILAGYLYPSEGDLATGNNPAILAAIYADPESRTTADSPTPQKQSVLHFTLVMLVGQQFGLDYQAELGAYERTASPAFRIRVATDSQAWLDLPCGPWASIRAMFLAVMA